MLNSVYLFAATRWEVSHLLYQLPDSSVILTGIGMKNSYKIPHSTQCSLSISFGFSGATHESLRPYDIVLANQTRHIVYQKGWQTKEELVFPEWNLSSYHDTRFEHSRVVWGQIGTVHHLILTPLGKKNLGESQAVCAIDMESFGISQAAKKYNSPFLAIRIILDSVDEPLFGWRPWQFPKRVSQAREILGRFVAGFLEQKMRPLLEHL